MASDTQHGLDTDMSAMWDDPSFNNLQYEHLATTDSPFDANGLFDFGATANVESPNFAVRTPSKSGYEGEAGPLPPQTLPIHARSLIHPGSAESSSQDSSSESSTRRKRKTTSESPPTNKLPPEEETIKSEDLMMDQQDLSAYQNFGTSMHNLSLDRDFASQNVAMGGNFDFGSNPNSPGMMDNAAARIQTQAHMQGSLPNALQPQTSNEASAGTIQPSQFFFGSADGSPASIKAGHGQDASPGAMFSNATPNSDNVDMFGSNPTWGGATQNPAWSTNYANEFTSPGALGLTPSPVMNSVSNMAPMVPSAGEDRIPLHIAPIPTKSRVETQINIKMTLERLPPGITQLHLPTHTIAKAKLLAKEVGPREDTLELHTMLVCTSAMNQPQLRERALQQAATQDNGEIQRRGEAGGPKKEEGEEDEADKPANGGEVRICTNCINRERKRAARKKLKKEEEQAHWERYETERVIVFNTNEYKPWQEWQQSPPPKETGTQAGYEYQPSESAMQVIAPMRIACYCRHQNEKDGFRVIFTIKNHRGKIVAQQMSDSILITDDHKTHPLATMPGAVWYNDGQYPAPGPFASQSMVDLHSHMPSMSMSKSTGNLQGLGYGGPAFHQPSNMHQIASYPSQPTSATMTPRNLSRPASPTGATAMGPNKKRKSSSAHRRIPSGLTMTRVDTNQPMASGMPSAGTGPFSPTSAGFVGGNDGSYISLPHSGSRAHFHTGPPTPNENTPFAFGSLNRTTSLDNSNYAFYSAPSSAHQSRAPSPVLQGPNLAAFQRQQAMPVRGNPYAVNQTTGNRMQEPDRPSPIISKVTPAEGPTSGGIEISIYGSGFTHGMEVMFGDQIATATTFWGEKALCAVLPPGKMGTVPVTIAPSQSRQMASPTPSGQAQLFRYTGQRDQTHMMELALRFLSEKQTGNPEQWQALAQSAAGAYINQSAAQSQQSGMQGMQGSHFMTTAPDPRYAPGAMNGDT